jgi:hypothetical protein
MSASSNQMRKVSPHSLSFLSSIALKLPMTKFNSAVSLPILTVDIAKYTNPYLFLVFKSQEQSWEIKYRHLWLTNT